VSSVFYTYQVFSNNIHLVKKILNEIFHHEKKKEEKRNTKELTLILQNTEV
jgi:hypothetical protein